MWANIQGMWEISVLLVNFAVDLKLLYKIKLTLKKKKNYMHSPPATGN